MERPKAPGLKFRPRKGAPDAAYWFAPREAVAAGFEPKSVRLHYDGWEDDHRLAADLVARCHRLQAEVLMFMSAGHQEAPAFDGTFGVLIDRYLTDPESTYRSLKPSSLHPYTIYAAKLKQHIGEVRIDHSDGRDVKRWFRTWAGVDHLEGAVPDPLKHPEAKLPRARSMFCVLKAAVAFGIVCRLTGSPEFDAILGKLSFPVKKRRAFAPTAEHIEAARMAAHAAGARSRALAYALQFETTLRQWDVIGIWVPLSDHRTSPVIDGSEKWIGPTWSMVSDQLILKITHSKTEDTSETTSTYDLKVCPMVLEELQHVADRNGPLIVNERTGVPYRYERFQDGWKRDFRDAGLPAKMWNRDFRAGAITEGGMAGATSDDRRKVAGHTTDRQIAQVYDRDTLEAHRRVMKARSAARKNAGGK
jgi:hypothetical protein